VLSTRRPARYSRPCVNAPESCGCSSTTRYRSSRSSAAAVPPAARRAACNSSSFTVAPVRFTGGCPPRSKPPEGCIRVVVRSACLPRVRVRALGWASAVSEVCRESCTYPEFALC